MVISISGDIDEDSTVESAEGLFGGVAARPAVAEEPRLPGPSVAAKRFDSDKTESLICVGFRTAGVRDDDRYVLEAIGSLMSGASGRLFTNLRDKLPLAYSLGCTQTMTPDFGYLAFYVATVKEEMDTSSAALMAEIDRIKSGPVTDEELESAKRELKSAHSLARQANSFYTYNSALDELYGLGYDNLYRHDAAVSRVTKADIARVATKYLMPDNSSTVTFFSKDQP